MKNIQEFNVGDEVTFKPYESFYKCVVREVFVENGEYWYKLENVKSEKSCKSKTTGKCILESIFYMTY